VSVDLREPLRAGARLANDLRLGAVAALLSRTATLAFCEGRVFDEHGQPCAHATATFIKYLHALPTKGRHAKAPQHAAPPTTKEAP
jgi:hypothetical protein